MRFCYNNDSPIKNAIVPSRTLPYPPAPFLYPYALSNAPHSALSFDRNIALDSGSFRNDGSHAFVEELTPYRHLGRVEWILELIGVAFVDFPQ